jgi:hypothetical protein
MPIGGAKHQAGLAADDTKYLMAFGMVVVVVINPVTPLRRPSIGAESFLEQCSWVGALNGNDQRSQVCIAHAFVEASKHHADTHGTKK